ncbi:Uncharacterised protein [Mycobacteroides abscessus subsp. abscessus]|nr:Uncharacterised protein [Mycobacteroides abscessus subsp. abscessus]
MTVVLDDDVPRLTEMVVVDHHIAGHYEPVSPCTPAAEQLYESVIGALLGVTQGLAQGRFHESIAQYLSVGQW